ncbi:MAG: Mur ligase domain-containing protein [Chitinophagales bacterium]|nr:Mur ligase domain-containing protein [Chitinophagales bacterium]
MSTKNIHIIAIGGAAMHNIALDLHDQGNIVTGSDDEIYDPAWSRLQKASLAPEAMGWFPDKIHSNLDYIILGMHAKTDNPELLKAQQLGIPVYSYPAFVFLQSQNKKRVVIAGSHGKTTTTAMVMHVLKKLNMDFDYLVGAQLEGFDRMVRLSDAPLIIIEGDEYLSSPIDRRPKILHYKPDIAVITGIAWDHINVFPTFDHYKEQFKLFCDTINSNGTLIYYEQDPEVAAIASNALIHTKIGYSILPTNQENQVVWNQQCYPIQTIGNHNLQNMRAAGLVCEQLGIDIDTFFKSIYDFTGASKRLQKISSQDGRQIYLDFAHAPSKVTATTQSFKAWFDDKPLLAVLELHTFSSLNPEFIGQYKGSLDAAENAVVFYNEHTLKIKNMPALDRDFVQQSFGHPNLQIFTDEVALHAYISSQTDCHILLMTSGNFNKMSLDFTEK